VISPELGIRVNVDPANPGQFFACCGLLELADRSWEQAEGWFERGNFCIATAGELPSLIDTLSSSNFEQLDPIDNTASPIKIGPPFGDMRLDWWHDERSGGKELKVWAGTMESFRIARAMQNALRDARFQGPDLFDVGVIAYDPDDAGKKVEPYYFDSRRGPNAHSRDVGFSPNDLQMTTTAFPAVELLCFIGLQRALPAKTDQPRVFEYYTWTRPLPPSLIPAAVSGLLPQIGRSGYRFENWYRTGQRKHKAFRAAIPIPSGGD
jgi:CRISPR-associated protein Csb3